METVYTYVQDKMGKTVSVLKQEYSAIRAGRANPAVLDKIKVDYYGTPTPINQMAAVSVAEARILTIQPWDISTLHTIEKAIMASDLGINPQNDGRVIRLVFPQPTEERRRELGKEVSKMAEDSKVAIRSIRRDGIDKLKKMEKASEITEDDLKEGEKKLQEFTDKFIKENIGRKIVVVGASVGTDAHTVGIDAVMNMKGYAGHYGLERYEMIEAYNLGSQVPNEEFLAKGIELHADALLVSQTVTQKDVHIKTLTNLVELMEAEGLRDKMILCCGGARITHELAKELGYDAGFGMNTYADDVASFIVAEMVKRGMR